MKPNVVVADILTLAPALAGEIEGVPWATLIPHIYPDTEPQFPIYSVGARLPRTGAGRWLWRRAQRPVERGLEIGRLELNETRAGLGLAPVDHPHGGISRPLALVGTFPQLEYPRTWPEHIHVVGPLMWEPPADDVELPMTGSIEGPRHWYWSRHRQRRILSTDCSWRRCAGLADAPVRVLATWNRRLPPRPLPVPENARLVDWVSYSRTMPHCDAIVCHAGHGTLVRALACGRPVVACPAVGDMNENAARLDWAGAGCARPAAVREASPAAAGGGARPGRCVDPSACS